MYKLYRSENTPITRGALKDDFLAHLADFEVECWGGWTAKSLWMDWMASRSYSGEAVLWFPAGEFKAIAIDALDTWNDCSQKERLAMRRM
jgi:hypothetical protein